MDLPLSMLAGFLVHAIEQEREQYAWELWKSLYPDMQSGLLAFVKLEDFKKRIFNPQQKQKHSRKTKQEILTEMGAVVEANRRRR